MMYNLNVQKMTRMAGLVVQGHIQQNSNACLQNVNY